MSSTQTSTDPRAARTVTAAQVAEWLPKRQEGAHKWGVGAAVIVAGGPSYIGAAALSAIAAGRAGAGIVQLAIPRSAMGAVATLSPETVFIPLRDGDLGSAKAAIEAIKPKLDRSHALLVGPGLGEDEDADALMAAIFGFTTVAKAAGFGFQRRVPETAEVAQSEALITNEKPTIIDADGLNWLAKNEGWAERVPAHSLILTPHPGEMSRLLARPVGEILADPVKAATDAAKTWGQIVVLKAGATVATDGESTLIADDAPASLATAGSGDVFSGFIAGLLAQGAKPLDAAAIAIFAGTRAARKIEQRFGVRGLIASDLPAAMAEELAALENGR